MEVRRGFQQTEVGFIPEDWKVVRIGDLYPFITSGSRGWASYYSERGAPFVRITNLSRKSIYINTDDLKYVNLPSETSEGIRTQLQVEDVLISITADIGIIGYVTKDLPQPAYINQHIALVRISPDKADSKFVSYFLASENPQKLFLSMTDLGAKAGMSLITVQKIQLALPPLPEQRAIATAFSDMDALLNSLDALITKKRLIKKGATQTLLAGKKRLPGFSGDWVVSTLKQLADIQAGINKPISSMGSGTLYVTVQELYEGTSIPVHKLGRIQLTKKEIEAKSLIKGDIVFGKSSVKREGIGYPNQFLGWDEPVVFSGFTFRARAYPEIVNPVFLFYMLRWQNTRRWLIDNSQASALTNINQSIANNIPISYPSVAEQTAIAEILSNMDAEISALEQKREKTRLLKQGMMQELLTGRIRLV